MTPAAQPDDQHLHLIKDVPFRPVFIIGDHRSGTTLLHRLMAETGCYNYVTAYHVIRYNQVLDDYLQGNSDKEKAKLADQFEALGLKNRIIDEVPATPDAPVEYGFILAGALNTRRALLTPQAQAKFDELCRKMQYVSDPQRRLLLKNPWDVLNFADIHGRVQGARYIFIHRHPVAVMTSQMRAIRSMLQTQNPFVTMLAPWYARLYKRPGQLFAARAFDWPPFHIWVRLVGLHATRVAKYFLEHIGPLPAADYTSIRYEDLCQRPAEVMNGILDFAGARPATDISWANRIQTRPPKVAPEVLRRYRQLVSRLRPYLEYHGYEAEPSWLQQ